MAPWAVKSAIRDAGRVFELPLPDTDRIAKLMPDTKDLSDILSNGTTKNSSAELNGDDLQNANDCGNSKEESHMKARC
jgi:DNA polymerase-3 subunit alpha